MKSKHGKQTKKISILAVLVALICMTLAVSVMANDDSNYEQGDSCYTVGDLNSDGIVDESDALYLLYHTVNPEAYPLGNQNGNFDEGEDETISGSDALALLGLIVAEDTKVHGFGEPDWIWSEENGEVTVRAEYTCACGEKSYSADVTLKEDEDQKVAATCTTNGKVVYVATSDFGYTSEYTVVSQATDHRFEVGAAACVAQDCLNGCGYTKAAEPHTPAGTPQQVAVEGKNCTYQEADLCTACGATVCGKEYVKHAYKASIAEAATCVNDGKKVFTCTGCGYVDEAQTEIIAKSDALHIWNDGTKDSTGKITHTCKVDGCTATKTTIAATEETETGASATVDKDTLASVGEVELKDAAIKLDEATLGQLAADKDVAISVETTDKSALSNLDGELANQIGNNTVYNFSMTSGNDTVSEFDGEITITLPYTLEDGDDVDCIDIWFIDNDGNVTVQKGTYNNGYVTFTTDHFSYYTVTRLTPAQRCEAYGHVTETKTYLASCEADGYTLSVCSRCGLTEKTNVVTATGHDYAVKEEQVAGCTSAGYQKHECNNCGAVKETVLTALGHNYGAVVEVAPTCETRGYDAQTCDRCGHEKIQYTTSLPAGHVYAKVWDWDEENLTATLVLDCEKCDSVVEKEANIGIEKQVGATCTDKGYVLYSAQTQHNGVPYSDTYKVEENQLAHKITNEWKYNGLNHYKVCSMCNGKVNETAHKLSEAVVAVEPTCTDAGAKVASCDCGYVATTEIQALGHNLVDGYCSRCNFTTITCDHNDTYEVEVDLSKYCKTEYGEVPYFSYITCECGKNAELNDYGIFCDIDMKVTYTTDENGYRVEYHVGTCEDCGLKCEVTVYWEVDDKCNGAYCQKVKLTDKDGSVVVDFDGVVMKGEEHPQVIYGETEDLTKYGLCGGTAAPTSCACGEYKSTALLIDKCELEYLYEESNDALSAFICRNCGIKMLVAYNAKELDKCHYLVSEVFDMYKNDEHLASYQLSVLEPVHDCDYEVVLAGDTCTDGYDITYTCKNCDYEESYFNKPESCEYAAMYEEIDVSEYDICVDEMYAYVCPCGEYTRIMGNDIWEGHDEIEIDFEYEDDDYSASYYVKYECADCGLIYEATESQTTSADSCEAQYCKVAEYKVNGTVIVKEDYKETHISHDSELISYTLNGDTCEDGVKLVFACAKCGEIEENYVEGGYHPIYEVASYDLADYGMCGGTVYVYSCPCQEEQWINEVPGENEESCNWMHWSYDDRTGTSTWKCTECGMYRQEVAEEVPVDGCLYRRTEMYDYMSAYEVLISAKVSREEYRHDCNYEFDLGEGTTCKDGFYVVANCRNCDYTDRWYEEPWGEEEHSYYQVESYSLSDFGFCGGDISHTVCPCGEIDEWYTNTWGYCDWEYLDKSDNRTEWRQCRNCKNIISDYCEEVAEEGCQRTEENIKGFYDAEENVLFELEYYSTYESHNSVADLILDEGATSCSEGYMVYETCMDCGNVRSYHEYGPEEHHWTYRVESIDLADFGFCGGFVGVERCACGDQVDFFDVDMQCQFDAGIWDEATQSTTETCLVCNSKRVYIDGEETLIGCDVYFDRMIAYYNADGIKAYENVLTVKHERHDLVVVGYEMYGTSCEDGMRVYYSCARCGESMEGDRNYHETTILQNFDLAAYGVCPGMNMYTYSCICGEYQGLSIETWNGSCQTDYDWKEYTDDAGVKHSRSVETCRNCGLKIERDGVAQSIGNCQKEVTYAVSVSINGTMIYAGSYVQIEDEHNWSYSYTLMPGAEDCEDGVIVTEICINCGNVQTGELRHHAMSEIDAPDSRIDLSLYGSNCGGYLVQKACACGKSKEIAFEGKCDLGYSYITPWLGQAYDYQETSRGWMQPAYGAWDVKCAVTDPDCDLYMRMCEYSVYDKDTCTMQEYVVWQIGYDAQTGTCQKEITLVNKSYAYHTYTEKVEIVNTEDGGQKEIKTFLCDCGSSVVETSVFNANSEFTSFERVCRNTLSNGENVYRLEQYSYDYINGHQVMVDDYHEYLTASGQVEWSDWSYTYTNDCKKIEIYTNSNGSYDTYEREYHIGEHKALNGETASCTQNCRHYKVCYTCGTVDYNDYWEETPYGHWYDNGVCQRCGLESENEADGAIWLEDLSATYGNGTNYVIGFWNRDNIEFVNNIVIVTADGEEVVLSGIGFTVLTEEVNGITAISINKAEVGAAMSAAGVTGDIRIAFVPLGNGTDLDYAITLTK